MARSRPSHVADAAELGRRIRRLREERGLSLRGLAFPGCSPSYLSRLEAGQRAPSLPVLHQLAERLGVSVDALRGDPPQDRIADRDLAAVELAVRLGQAGAEGRVETLLAEARSLGDRGAESRLLEGLGLLALESRDDERAIRLLEEALRATDETTPRARPALHRALGRAYAGIGDLERSIGILRAGFESAGREPVDPDLLALFGTFLANAYTDAGHIGEAESVLARVIAHERELAPGNALRLQWALARTYAEEGRCAIAESYVQGILARVEIAESPALAGKAHLLLAGVLLDQGQTEDAVPHLDEAEPLLAGQSDVDRVQLSLERARVAVDGGDFTEAERRAREALDLSGATEPAHAGSAYAVLARVELDRGNLDQARFLCVQAIDGLQGRAAPHHVGEAYRTLALVEEEAGDLPAALAALRARPPTRFG
ncbi:MAG: helix-turn-helix domain-containing protein [Gaiellales bacterium]